MGELPITVVTEHGVQSRSKMTITIMVLVVSSALVIGFVAHSHILWSTVPAGLSASPALFDYSTRGSLEITIKIPLTNESDELVHIESADHSCSCITLERPQSWLSPGGNTLLVGKWSLDASAGFQNAEVTVNWRCKSDSRQIYRQLVIPLEAMAGTEVSTQPPKPQPDPMFTLPQP